MSRIGKKAIEIPQGVKVELKGQNINVSGPLGQLQTACDPKLKIRTESSKIIVENPEPQNRLLKQVHGTTRSLIWNMVSGVTKGFQKKLEIYGTGYNVKTQGEKLLLSLGFANTVEMKIPKLIKINIDVPATKGNDTPAVFTLTSIDKCLLGQFAAQVRKIKPPEPYKGKGIRYAEEYVRKKAGKAFTSGPV
jgi:large subunit ribosomal protein L6